MRLFPKFLRATLLVSCTLALVASMAIAGGARGYKDDSHESYQVSIRANANRVLSGTFTVLEVDALQCTNGGGSVVGSWTVRNVKIQDGRFHAVKSDSTSDSVAYRLTLRGALKGDTIRGAVSLHRIFRDGKESYECWSGKSKSDSFVKYVATTK